MSEATNNGRNFIGYEYRDITVDRDLESLYADGYQNFGWVLDGAAGPLTWVPKTRVPKTWFSSVTMRFKRDRKIRNKAELTRLQRQFDACVNEIKSMEKSKSASATIAACSVGLIGTAFLAGATFAYLGGLIVLCIILAIPGFIGWIIPYFLYNLTYAKKSAKVAPLIENKHDEIYEVCERANSLLGSYE